MAEEINKIISNSIDTYTKNTNLCIPFILNIVMIALTAIIITIFSLVYLFGSVSVEEYNSPEALSLAFISSLSHHVYEIAAIVLVGFLVIMYFSSFFTSGAIGMARQATETGRTTFSTMMESGKKNALNLFLAEILFLLLVFAGIVFMVPGAMNLDLNQLSIEDNYLLMIGFVLWIVYFLILSLALSAFSYVLVIESLGPVEGIVAGVNFFKKNASDVFLIILATIGVSFVFGIIDAIMSLNSILNTIWFFVSLLISVCILSPVLMLWWVRLYMTRTDKQVYFNDLLAHPNDLPKP
ncbi:MAG: hypothetical protein D4R88_08875 [Methanosarcinales archaeon]|nr:MAG: hypothetical protein D4R88_08875 [Methanosarcinales archaeon]